jgi:hypothetical protein
MAIGIIPLLIIGLVISIAVGFVKNRIVRIIAWIIAGLCTIALLVFVYIIIHTLTR